MADKAVSELIEAERITATDLFVLEQNGTAKKLTGQILLNWLTAAADGHGGIQSISKLKTEGLADTYRITLADTTIFDFVVTNGRSVSRISKTSTSGLADTYTIEYNDGTTGTFIVTNGAKGDKGDNTYVWIKYASTEPTEASHSFGSLPDDWIGIYFGPLAEAPADWREYAWYQIKGEKGDTGEPATLVSSSVTYQLGDSGSIIPSGAWSESVAVVPQGKYLWTRIVHQFNTGDPVTSYSVSRMGMDGAGSVSSVAGISPDLDGNVPLTADDVKALPTSGGNMTGAINMNGQKLNGLNAPVADDEAANMGYVKRAYPRNLLDNSDFRNPVNQRGSTNYVDLGYTIDRWTSVNYGNTVTVADGYIHLKTTEGGSWRQYIEKANRYIGKKMTIAAKLLDGSIVCASGTVPNTSDDAEIVTYKGPDYEVSLHQFSGNLLMQFSVFASEISIKWAAIYEGEYTAETLPEYQPKGYGAELAECQRYYYQSWTGATIGSNGILLKEAFTSARLISVDLPCEMRVTPTISICKTDGTANAVSEYVTSTTVTNVSVVYANNKSFIPAQQSSGFTAGKVYSLHYTASADL